MQTLITIKHKPFALSYKIPDGFDLICNKCTRYTCRCQCEQVDYNNCDSKAETHTIKVRGSWCRYKTPTLFTGAYYRRRYKTLTLTEENEETSLKAIQSYFQFVQTELQTGLIPL